MLSPFLFGLQITLVLVPLYLFSKSKEEIQGLGETKA